MNQTHDRGRKTMVHDFITGNSRTAHRYSGREYWHAINRIEGMKDGDSFVHETDIVPTEPLHATQIACVVIEQFRADRDMLDSIDKATCTLYRITAARSAALQAEDLAEEANDA